MFAGPDLAKVSVIWENSKRRVTYASATSRDEFESECPGLSNHIYVTADVATRYESGLVALSREGIESDTGLGSRQSCSTFQPDRIRVQQDCVQAIKSNFHVTNMQEREPRGLESWEFRNILRATIVRRFYVRYDLGMTLRTPYPNGMNDGGYTARRLDRYECVSGIAYMTPKFDEYMWGGTGIFGGCHKELVR